MKKIKLTQGKFALVDNEWFDYLNQWKWCYVKPRGTGVGYAERGIYHGTSRCNHYVEHIRMHRFIMDCVKGDGVEIDHKDNNGLNNQTNNLRRATDLQNAQNRRKPPHNTSGYKGVSRWKNGWGAYIHVNKKIKFLGLYNSKRMAAAAYDNAAFEHFGEYARLNFPIAPRVPKKVIELARRR